MGSRTPLVYLACAMSGRTWADVVRQQLALNQLLHSFGMDSLSPINGLDLRRLNPAGNAAAFQDYGQPFVCPPIYVARDLAMLRACDAVLADYRAVPEGRPSEGMTFELGFAHALSKPVVILAGRGAAISPFVASTTSALADDPDEAVSILAGFLCPGVTLTGRHAAAWTGSLAP